MPVSLTNGSEAMVANVVSFPLEPAKRSTCTGWRSIGEAAGQVLSGVAYRYAVASRAYPTLLAEAGEWAEIIPVTGSAE